MKKIEGKCPLCEKQYHKRNRLTHHHVFPKTWYHGLGPQVEVCQKCHSEFNRAYPMKPGESWCEELCLINWSQFCEKKRVKMTEVYPQLKNLKW